MRQRPREALCEIVAACGRALCDDPRRCEALLRDLCPGFDREIFVLTSALKAGIAADATVSALPPAALIARLAKRLQDDLSLTERAARWTAVSWALALGVFSEAEVEIVEIVEPSSILDGDPSAGPISPPDGGDPSMGRLFETGGAKLPPAVTFVVSPVGPAHFRTIGDAIRNALPGSRIFVRPGLYVESLVLDRPIEIVGAGQAHEAAVESAGSSGLRMETDYAVVRALTLRGRSGARGEAHPTVDIPGGRLVLDDCDVTSDSLACISVHGTDADPIVRRCRIGDGTRNGITFSDGCAGRIEECDLFRNGWEAIEIGDGTRPSVLRCRVRNGRQSGISVLSGGGGTIDSCEIIGNAYAGIEIQPGGDPRIHRCRIQDNGREGVWVYKNGSGRVDRCDLTHNARGAWRAPFQWRLVRALGNRE